MTNDGREYHSDEDPCYVISIAAKMVRMHAQSLRHYERLGLVRPSRSRGRVRLYSPADIERLRHIQRLGNGLGGNPAGAGGGGMTRGSRWGKVLEVPRRPDFYSR